VVQWCSGAVVQWCNGARAMAQWRRGAVVQMLRCCGGFEQVLSFSRGDCFLCRCAEVQWYHNGTEVHRFTGAGAGAGAGAGLAGGGAGEEVKR
jgi:hypothetical protein